ncbi:helix-turn-helix transcriptional regulator [Streptomyces sp. NPDC006733]|uniref:helix-turn-helix transcriptional regulator n=1 Tax=Streptomyces sp. NPDC006733 TaxID=3155460 RepID=UPI0034092971
MRVETDRSRPPCPPAATPTATALARELVRLRLERGLSLRRLARLVGMTAHSGLVDYERGVRIPPDDLMAMIVRALRPADDRLARLYRAAVAERARQKLAAGPHGGAGCAAERDLDTLLAEGTDALVVHGDPPAGRQHFERAHQLAERAGDPVALGIAALGLSGLWPQQQRTAAGAALVCTRLRHALSLVDPQSSLGLRLRIRLAAEGDDPAGTHTAVLAALDEARSVPDPVARVEALGLAHHCLLGPDHGELRRALAVELVEESVRTGRRGDVLTGVLWRTVAAFLEADPRAQRLLMELRELLAAGNHRAVAFVADAMDVMLTIRSGRFDEAEALARACAQRGAAIGDVNSVGWLGTHLVAIRWFQGRLPELLPGLRVMVHSPVLSARDHSGFAALAVAAAQAGSRREAAGALATLCGRGLANLPRSTTWLGTMGGVVEAAHLLRDRDTSARAYELLEPFAHLPAMSGPAVVCFGSVHHSLGVAALTTGDADRSVEHLRAAITGHLAMAHWPAVMTSRVRYAQALTLRGRPDDAAAARLELATAAEEAAAMGIAPPAV